MLVVIVVSEVVEKVLARALSSAPFAAKHLCEWGGGAGYGGEIQSIIYREIYMSRGDSLSESLAYQKTNAI